MSRSAGLAANAVAAVLLTLGVAGCGAPVAPASAACTMAMPAMLGVSGLGVASVAAPVPDKLPGQIVQRWQTASLAVETRWPASPRVLFADRPPTPDDDLVDAVQMEYANHVHLVVQSPGDPVPRADIDVLIPDVRAAEALPIECQMLQVTMVDGNGGQQTLAVRLEPNRDTGPTVEDWGPLVGRRSRLPRELRPDEVPLCAGVPGVANAVDGAPVMPSPAEALNAFLLSPEFAVVPRPTAWRPFAEISSSEPGLPSGAPSGVRFEHLVTDTQFVSIEVTRAASGWAVSYWLTGEC
jgi:hypothetical protein